MIFIDYKDIVNSLKVIAKNQNAAVDFTSVDNLFLDAKTQINNYRYTEATHTSSTNQRRQ